MHQEAKRTRRRDFLIAFSATNLLFAPEWRNLLGLKVSPAFGAQPRWDGFSALVICTALVVAALMLLFTVVRRAKSRVPLYALHVLLFAFVVSATEFFRARSNVSVEHPWFSLTFVFGSRPWPWKALVLASGGAGALWLLTRGREKALFALRALLILVFPFGLLSAGEALSALLTPRQYPAPAPLAAAVRSEGQRVIWIVYDELDYDIAFEHRPKEIALPALDRFRNESLSATNAFPPSNTTVSSMSAYLTGKMIDRIAELPDGDISITPCGENDLKLGETPTVLTYARSRGVDTALVGWYLPYCRMFGKDLSYCHRESIWQFPYSRSLPANIAAIFERLIPVNASLGRLKAELHVRLDAAIDEALADPRYRFLFFHRTVPHLPGIWDIAKERLRYDDEKGLEAYLGNVVLADRTLANTRSLLEKEGRWDSSAVIVTADHWYRTMPYFTPAVFAGHHDFRVPMMIKFPNQKTPLVYDKPLNTLTLHELAKALLDGGVKTAQEAVDWLDAHRRVEAPIFVTHPEYGVMLKPWKCNVKLGEHEPSFVPALRELELAPGKSRTDRSTASFEKAGDTE